MAAANDLPIESGSARPTEWSLLTERFPDWVNLQLVSQAPHRSLYTAQQRSSGQGLSVSVVNGSDTADPEFTEHFMREARILARLRHPRIAAVLDYGEVFGLHYLVRESVAGVILHEALRNQTLLPDAALVALGQLFDSLAYAEEQGVVSPCLMPEGIRIDTAGQVKITELAPKGSALAGVGHLRLLDTFIEALRTPLAPFAASVHAAETTSEFAIIERFEIIERWPSERARRSIKDSRYLLDSPLLVTVMVVAAFATAVRFPGVLCLSILVGLVIAGGRVWGSRGETRLNSPPL